MYKRQDLRERIRKLDRFLSDPPVVSDTVRGTRKDGTIGPIKITGIPVPEYSWKEKIRERYREMLAEKEAELLELTCKAEEYIESVSYTHLDVYKRQLQGRCRYTLRYCMYATGATGQSGLQRRIRCSRY